MASRLKRAESPGNGVSKLRMDRKPNATRINDPSHPAGKRKEIDNVMKKARQSNATNDYWDKKLLEVEEKDPNRWRHTGYKKMYIHNNESSSGSESEKRDKFRYNGGSSSRKSPVSSRKSRSRSPVMRKLSPRPRSPAERRPRPRPRSPDVPRKRSPPNQMRYRMDSDRMGKRPPSPPPKARSPSSMSSSSSEDSCSACDSDDNHRPRNSNHPQSSHRMMQQKSRPHQHAAKDRREHPSAASRRAPPSPAAPNHKHRNPREASPKRRHEKVHHRPASPVASKSRHQQPPEPPEPSKKSKEKPAEKMRARVKIEGEPKSRRQRRASSSSDDSTSSESSIPTITATTRLTLSERFGKIAQWSVDRSNMENMNMKITKNSSGGDLKVLIEDSGMRESPPRKYRYSPAPQGHFPEELMTQAPMGLASWDNVQVRYEYYKGRGYLRDLNLNDYIKWEEWWYKYQAWLKQERYYEMWERSQMNRRRRIQKKIPITQRLN